jgi:hypothetical protein
MGEKFPSQTYQHNGDFTDPAWTAFSEAHSRKDPPENISKTLDKAYQGDFEDAAWTKFSDAQLPPRRVTLEDFAKHPFIPYEITSKGDYVRQVITRFADALKEAGYKANEVDGLISKSLDAVDFNRPAEAFVAEINRIIQNFYKAAPGIKTATVEKPSSEAIVAPIISVSEVDRAASAVIPIVPTSATVEQNGNPIQAPKLEDTSEVDNLRLTTEFDEREAEYAEYGNRKNEAVRLVPLFSEGPVSVAAQNSEVVSEVRPLEKPVLENPLPEKLVLTSAFKMGEHELSLEKISNLEFSQITYLEFINTVHTDVRAKFDAVKNSAKTNLRMFSPTYTPGIIEKEALQFLPSLQAQMVGLGAYEREVTDYLVQETGALNVDEIKRTAHNYVVKAEDLLDSIEKLQDLIEKVPTEEKPHQAEAYRVQLEKIRIEGNRVLATVSNGHPLYEQFKYLVIDDLSALISDLAGDNGNKLFTDQSPAVMARRDRIKAAIDYMKTEHECNDYHARAEHNLNEIIVTIEKISPISSDDLEVKNTIEANIAELKTLLDDDNQIDFKAQNAFLFPEMVKVKTEALIKQKNDIKNLLRATQEVYPRLSNQVEADARSEAQSTVLTDAKITQMLNEDKSAINAQVLWSTYQNFRRIMAEQNATQSTLDALERRRKLEASGLGEKVRRLAQLISPTKIGKVAALVLASYAGSAEKATEASKMEVLTGSMISGLNPVSFEINESTINEMLRTREVQRPLDAVELTQTNENAISSISPTINETIPEIKTPEIAVETIKGVFLPDIVNGPRRESDSPLKIYGEGAIDFPIDPGIVFESPKNIESVKQFEPYTLRLGDVFWDINVGKTLAGKLPFMEKVDEEQRNALIDVMRDQLNADKALREYIGGFGETANDLKTGKIMNLNRLDAFGRDVATKKGFYN